MVTKSRNPAVGRAAADQPEGLQPRALLIFDDAAQAEDLRSFLERARWRVDAFGSRDEALDALRDAKIHVVVADCAAPDEGGALLRDVATVDARARVVLLAEENVADGVAARNADAYACLAKPITPRALLSVLIGAMHDAYPAPARPRLGSSKVQKGFDSLIGGLAPAGLKRGLVLLLRPPLTLR